MINGLYRAILRRDLNAAYNCFLRVWKKPQQRNLLRWRLPFIICATSYDYWTDDYNDRASGERVWEDVMSLVKSPSKARDALALAIIVTRPDINFPAKPEVSLFKASLKRPFRSEILAALASSPLREEDYYLLRAVDFLKETRIALPNYKLFESWAEPTYTSTKELPWWVHDVTLSNFKDETGYDIPPVMIQELWRFLEHEKSVTAISIEPVYGYKVSTTNSYLWLELLERVCLGKLDFYREIWQQYITCQIRGIE